MQGGMVLCCDIDIARSMLHITMRFSNKSRYCNIIQNSWVIVILKMLRNCIFRIIIVWTLFRLIWVGVGRSAFSTIYFEQLLFVIMCFLLHLFWIKPLNQDFNMCVGIIQKGASCSIILLSHHKNTLYTYETIYKNSTV